MYLSKVWDQENIYILIYDYKLYLTSLSRTGYSWIDKHDIMKRKKKAQNLVVESKRRVLNSYPLRENWVWWQKLVIKLYQNSIELQLDKQ